MSMEADLLALFRGDEGLTALVADRTHWVLRPQATGLPAVTLTVIDGIPDYVTSGRSDLTVSRVQVDVWAVTFTSVVAVAYAVKAAVFGTDATGGYQSISNISVLSDRDLTDTKQPDIIFQRSIDLLVCDNNA